MKKIIDFDLDLLMKESSILLGAGGVNEDFPTEPVFADIDILIKSHMDLVIKNNTINSAKFVLLIPKILVNSFHCVYRFASKDKLYCSTYENEIGLVDVFTVIVDDRLDDYKIKSSLDNIECQSISLSWCDVDKKIIGSIVYRTTRVDSHCFAKDK